MTSKPQLVKFIDLIFALIVISLPFYSRLVFVMAMFWSSIRDEDLISSDKYKVSKEKKEEDNNYGGHYIVPTSPKGRLSRPPTPDSGILTDFEEEFYPFRPSSQLTMEDVPYNLIQEPMLDNFSPHSANIEDDHIQPMSHCQIIKGKIPDLKTQMEQIDETNQDLIGLISQTKAILIDHQDASLNSLHKDLTMEFKRIKEVSRSLGYQFNKEVRSNFQTDEAEHIIKHSTITQNKDLLTDAELQISLINSVIRSKGLHLTQTCFTPETISYPVFDGENLPLLGDFLKELQQLFIQVGLPVSSRGKVIAQSLRGKAHFILKHSPLGKDPSYDEQVEILWEHFGETSTQVNLIQRLHSQVGQIPTTLDLKNSMHNIFSVVSKHILLIESIINLQKQVGREGDKNTVFTTQYLNHLEEFLPRDKIQSLYNDLGYSSLRKDIRFQRLCDAFQRIKAFSMSDLAKTGYASDCIGFPFNPKIPPPSFAWSHPNKRMLREECTFAPNPNVPPPFYYV